ncbi:MAG: hypothetical protein M5U01_16880 [Ardenticatenaceae bacterium]|nr:hypothetical protein [Ardenticatenaceae bacterium]HBY98103.1 hypothetical protein [Chloroflexota bacterium]
MEEQPTVVLYGKSLLMAGLEVSLRRQPGLEVIRIDALTAGEEQAWEELRPDVVIFDVAAARLEGAFACLQEHPGVVLIGLHPASPQVTTLSTQQYPARTVKDLAQVIQALLKTAEHRVTIHPKSHRIGPNTSEV